MVPVIDPAQGPKTRNNIATISCVKAGVCNKITRFTACLRLIEKIQQKPGRTSYCGVTRRFERSPPSLSRPTVRCRRLLARLCVGECESSLAVDEHAHARAVDIQPQKSIRGRRCRPALVVPSGYSFRSRRTSSPGKAKSYAALSTRGERFFLRPLSGADSIVSNCASVFGDPIREPDERARIRRALAVQAARCSPSIMPFWNDGILDEVGMSTSMPSCALMAASGIDLDRPAAFCTQRALPRRNAGRPAAALAVQEAGACARLTASAMSTIAGASSMIENVVRFINCPWSDQSMGRAFNRDLARRCAARGLAPPRG